MKSISSLILLTLLIQSCNESVEMSHNDSINWEKRQIEIKGSDSLTLGTTYLSVYSEIYSQTEHTTHNLTATVSLRNTNRKDTVYIIKAEYFDTKGNSIRTYLNKPIFIAPMETVEIIIDEKDQEGGTGANFLFDWAIKPGANEPYFQAIMISTSGSQGISFTTDGKTLN